MCGFAEFAFLVIGMRADGFKDRSAGYIVEPYSAEGSEFAIICHSDNIQVAAVEGNTSFILKPLPALIFVIGFIGMECLQRKPTARGQLSLVTQSADGVSAWVSVSGISAV